MLLEIHFFRALEGELGQFVLMVGEIHCLIDHVEHHNRNHCGFRPSFPSKGST
jgi:hypothetical protein